MRYINIYCSIGGISYAECALTIFVCERKNALVFVNFLVYAGFKQLFFNNFLRSVKNRRNFAFVFFQEVLLERIEVFV